VAFPVTLYAFSKEVNSTARPSGTGVTYQCVTNTDFDVLNPAIPLNIGTDANPTQYNYCYIPAFQRYYWISSWSMERSLWVAHCNVDALASWKTQIGATSAYVLRAAAEHDDTIIDNLYPFETAVSITKDVKSSSWWDVNPANGSYCVGIVGSGATQYYVFNSQSLTLFLNYLLSDAYAIAALTALAVATNPELKVQLQPLQFISSIVWLPFNIASGERASNIIVGYVDCTQYAVCTEAPPTTLFQTIYTLQRHPLAESRGTWLNTGGASYSLYVPPFGHINLDPVSVANYPRLMTQIQVDTRTGSAVLDVFYGTEAEPYGKLDHHLTGQVGLAFQIGNNVSPGYGIGAFLSDVLPIATNALSANYGKAFSATKSAIGNIANAYIPRANTIGNTPSVAALTGRERVQYEWRTPVPEDNAHRGRPLCRVRRLDTLPGYQLCTDTDVSIPATREEIDTIRGYLEGGYYYE